VYWRQRSKSKVIWEADANTAFHHAQETQRLRKNFILLIRVNGIDIVNHDGKIAALTDFFRGVIGTPRNSVQVDLARLYEGWPRPSNMLSVSFTKEEAKLALFSMDTNSAPRPDGFGPTFFRAALGYNQGADNGFPSCFPLWGGTTGAYQPLSHGATA
jgi:hypothetical protein